MKTYTYSEARQRLAALLDQSARDGQVLIRRRDGSTFAVQSVRPTLSPLDVPGVRSTFRRGELVLLVREEREAAGTRAVDARAGAPPPRPKLLQSPRKRPPKPSRKR